MGKQRGEFERKGSARANACKKNARRTRRRKKGPKRKIVCRRLVSKGLILANDQKQSEENIEKRKKAAKPLEYIVQIVNFIYMHGIICIAYTSGKVMI